MSENKQDSGADTLIQTSLQKIKKLGKIEPKKKREKAVRFFLDADLQPSLKGSAFYYHVHKMPRVPRGIIRQWRKRGFKPLTMGIAHVRFEGFDKKYVFPAYFWNQQRVKP